MGGNQLALDVQRLADDYQQVHDISGVLSIARTR